MGIPLQFILNSGKKKNKKKKSQFQKPQDKKEQIFTIYFILFVRKKTLVWLIKCEMFMYTFSDIVFNIVFRLQYYMRL